MSDTPERQHADYVPDEVLAQCEQTDEGWLHPCGAILLAARVHHTVYNSPFPLGGYGQVQVQTVPYCPTCHEKPSDYGAPITLEMTAWPVVKIKRKVELIDGSESDSA